MRNSSPAAILKYAAPSVLIILIHHIYLRLFFFLVVFDICGDAVSEVGGFVVVVEVDRVVAEVAYIVCGAAVTWTMKVFSLMKMLSAKSLSAVYW